jgi:carbamoyl-phosphate synthase large subunit
VPDYPEGPRHRVTLNVAILGVGALVGQGVIKSLRMPAVETRLVAMDFFPGAVGLYWSDSPYLRPDVLDPATSDEEYIQRLGEILI